jgi:acyl-CoA thioester hydrolase
MEVRWADLDPNFHLRHSVYYDYGATARIDFLQQHGITPAFMQQHAFGPVIFREECLFKKEIRPEDKITIDLNLQSASPDYARWSIRHTIFKNINIVSAVITVDGAWIDVVKRKLTIPPAEVVQTFNNMQRNEQFKWT